MVSRKSRSDGEQLGKDKVSSREKTEVTADDLENLSTIMDKHCDNAWEIEEAENVLPLVARLGMQNMVTKLSTVLANALTLVTCIQLFQLASQSEVEVLWETSKDWISDNFVQVSQATEDFWKLTLDEMCVFVYSNTLCANEEDIFQAITLWVGKDRDSRITSSPVLLRAVQFRHCTLKFLESKLVHYLVHDNSDIEDAVKDAIEQNINRPFALKRTERHCVMFVLGGYSSDSVTETYSAVNKAWKKQKIITDQPSTRTHALTTGHQILVLEEYNKKFRSFDTLTKKWNDLRPLPVFRDGMSAAMEGNELFFMGGEKHESRCDVYDMHLDSWTVATSLKVSRWNSASSSLKGNIYCCGGRVYDGQLLSSMEVFDPREKNKGWTLTTSMSARRSQHCLVSSGQYLWAVGGYDGLKCPTDLERYEPTTNSWTKMASMPSRRYGMAACFFAGRIYVIGGCNTEFLTTVEVYNPGENRWTTGASLNRERRYHASCVVNEMSNTDEYQ